jgi:uncharacterized protein involved in type VI secretion and phage assembly
MQHDLLEQLLDWVRSHHFGKHRGTVTDNQDPASRGRLKVRVPAALGDLEVWAMPCAPYAGDQVGFYCLPEPGTGVWVEFEGGDLSYPIYSGFFWADGELPGPAGAGTKTFRTGALTLTLDDPNKKLIVMAQDGGSLEVGAEVVAVRDQSKHSVAAGGVTAEAGSRRTELTTTSFSVNGGSLEVT